MGRSKNASVAGYAEAFRPVQSDSQTSEWYSYFENDVLCACTQRQFLPLLIHFGTPARFPFFKISSMIGLVLISSSVPTKQKTVYAF